MKEDNDNFKNHFNSSEIQILKCYIFSLYDGNSSLK